MRKLIAIIAVVLTFSGVSFAQEAEVQTENSQAAPIEKKSKEKKDKKWNHYVGIQANLLLKQIISLDNTAEVNNPYLLKYSAINTVKNFAINASFGYEYSDNEDKDGFKSSLSDLSVKAGFGFVKKLGEKFILGYGMDEVFRSQNIKTINVVVFNDIFGSGYDSTITTTNSTELGFGGGLSASLAFNLSKNILIGTEASYYFIYSTTKLNVDSKRYDFDGFNPVVLTTTTLNEKTKGGALSLTLPVAIYLILRF